jgi:cytochrome c oxidase assembly protein subunit 15
VKTVVGISLIFVVILVSLSAYLRLAHSGIGCLDWPACYGRIGDPPAVSQPLSGQGAYQRIVAEASQPLAWATPMHRIVASVLGLLIVFLLMMALKQKRDRLVSLALLFVTVFLAVLGIKSGALHSPSVVMGNLGGGFVMLGLLGWMFFKDGIQVKPGHNKSLPTALITTAILILALQILMGGLTSANFAATSCQTLPDCHGSWLPGPAIWAAADLTRVHEVTSMGQVIGGQERIDIHIAHRIGAVLTTILLVIIGLMASRAGGQLRPAGITVILLVTAEFLIGISAIASDLPISLAVAHNWVAGLLLLALLRTSTLNRRISRAHE